MFLLIGDLRHHFPFLRYKDVLHERDKNAVSELWLGKFAGALFSNTTS